jgi:predicted acylesterase/phospholipase RssA/pimeloyl-ACP methyl ester carboxylesterase
MTVLTDQRSSKGYFTYSREARADRIQSIIALHGIAGSWDETWTGSGFYCWLSEIFPARYGSSRVISVDHPELLQDLGSTTVDVQNLILDLIQERTASGRANTPIIFIGHSFGGNLLKQIYVSTHPTNSSRTEYHLMHHLIRGYVYLGTPHKDLYFQDLSKLWRAIALSSTVASRPFTLQQALSSSSRINHEFRRLGGEALPSACFYETEKTYVGIQQQYIVNKDEATIASESAELTPLDAKHQYLGAFESDEDPNLRRSLGPIDRLMRIAEEPVIRQQGVATHHLRLLSLDGGGVKGLFSIIVLQRVIDEAQKLQGNESVHKRPCDYFDLIGGTSTGGLLAIMLGRLEMNTRECISTYRTLAKKIFWRSPWIDMLQPLPAATSALLNTSWYSGETLKDCVRKVVKDNLPYNEKEHLVSTGHLAEDARLVSSQPTKFRCFVCAVPSGEHKVERIRSYRSIDPNARNTSAYKIWEAARATSAAPMYFPRVHIGDRTYFDGGLESNNPVIEVIEEALEEFPGAKIDTIISIGTGESSSPDPHGTLNILKHFIHRATNTEAQHQRVLRERIFRDLLPGYFRLQGEAKLGEIDLAGFDKLDEIERLAESYLASSEGKHIVANCAARLATPIDPRAV